MYLSNYLIKYKNKTPNKKLFVFDNEEITYLQFYENVKNIIFNLNKIGLKKGDKIAILSRNNLIIPQLFIVASYLELSIVPINISISKKDIEYQLKKINVKFIFSWKEYLDTLNLNKININKINCYDINSNSKKYKNFSTLLENNDNKFKLKIKNKISGKKYLYGLTSGSTSDPKVVIWSQEVKILRSLNAKKIYNLKSTDIILLSTPMYHSISFRLIILPIVIGSTCVILENFTKKNWFNSIVKNKISFSILVSSQVDMIKNIIKNNKIKSLKTVVSCCSPLNLNVKKKLIKVPRINFFDTYGASEVGTITNINLKKEKNKILSNGKVNLSYKVKILYNKKLTSKFNTIGEICCKTNKSHNSYLYLANKKYINNNESYFKTGDLGYFDKNKYLYLSGRNKDVIIRAGINIFSTDIEKVLNKYYEIKESTVLSNNTDKLGEIILAFVNIKNKNKININKFYKYCINNLANYQIPSCVYSIDEFPRGALNKISKYNIKKNISKYANKKNLIFYNNPIL